MKIKASYLQLSLKIAALLLALSAIAFACSSSEDGGKRHDVTPPAFSNLQVTPDPAFTLDVVTITFEVSESLTVDPSVTVAGKAAAVVTVAGLDYTYEYVVTGSEGEGSVGVEVTGNDLAGNAGSASGTLTLVGGSRCLEDGESCLLDADCCGICGLLDGVCESPSWLSCTDPVRAIEPADQVGPDAAGKLRYLLDYGYDVATRGYIYEPHAHVFPIPFTAPLIVAGVYKDTMYPISTAKSNEIHLFYLETLGIRGYSNLAPANFYGLGDPTSTYEFNGSTWTMAYELPSADGDLNDDNGLAFTGNILSASTLYTKLASYDPVEDAYHSFAYTSLDLSAIRNGIEDGSITSIKEVKAGFAAQIRRARDLGFDGYKLKHELLSGTRESAMRAIVGLEAISGAPQPWAPDGDLFNGLGGLFATAAQTGMPMVIHGPDGGGSAAAVEWWSEGGLWDTILSSHPGLEITVAHGFAIANRDTGRGLDHKDQATECDTMAVMMLDLLDKYDGFQGRSMLRIDMSYEFGEWWRDHNELYQQGQLSYDYRSALRQYKRHFMIGSDPINTAVLTFQKEGCGDGNLERRYIGLRMRYEGPYWPDEPSVRYLNLVEPGYIEVLDAIYRENLFETVSATPEQAGPAGRDARGVRRIQCSAAIVYIDELIASVRTDYRGTTPQTDPIVIELEAVKQAFVTDCQQ